MSSSELEAIKINATDESEDTKPTWSVLSRVTTEYGTGFFWTRLGAYFFAFSNGLVLPLWAVLFKEILDLLTDPDRDITEESIHVMLYFFAMGLAAGSLTAGQFGLFGGYGAGVACNVRKAYFQTLLKQEIGYHDKKNSATINSLLTSDCQAIQEAIGVKLGFAVQQLTSFFGGIVLSFIYSWEMTLVLIACMPVLVIVGIIQGKAFVGAGPNADAFVAASSFTQETLTNIRTVMAFPSLIDSKTFKFGKELQKALPIAKKQALILGSGMGTLFLGLFIVYAIGLWYGANKVDDGDITIGDMFGCFFSFMIGGMALGQMGSVMGDIQKGMLAASNFWEIMERKPIIRPAEHREAITKSFNSSIEFCSVSFAYPSEPNLSVLKNISLKIEAGKTLAIVGPSGSGKSTIVNLLERFYDPKEGAILIGDNEIHNYDLKFLRSQFGLVSQMPLLFDVSIRENIRSGISNVSEKDIIEAATLANAHNFIQNLPKKYDTIVGEMGTRLSGGQRQRIAIARAMLSKPKILLLDEATSALDSHSEKEVQEALDKISATSKQTIVVIAHRLSTIRDADKIIVLVNGEIDSQGTHQELIDQDGIYAALVHSQSLLESKIE